MESLNNNGDVLQPRASRQHQKVTHEYCPGYIDKNAIWNNGFQCPRWGGPDDKYCCENGSEKFCCPEVTTRTSQTSTSVIASIPTAVTVAASFDFIPVVLGAAGGVLILLLAALILCIFCSSCPVYKMRHRKPRRPVMLTRTISVSLDAEATSSVIASQAISSGTSSSIQYSTGTESSYLPHQTSPSLPEEKHLHCGCRWSPRTSRSMVVDIDSIVASMCQTTALPWQTELDNLYNCYTCNGMHGSLCGSVRGNREFGPEDQTLLGIEAQSPTSTAYQFTSGTGGPQSRRLPLT